MTWQDIVEALPEYDIRENETTNEALLRLGFRRADHEAGGETCVRLRNGRIGACFGRHVERVSDGQPVLELGCSPPVSAANEWILGGCRMEEA